MSDSEDPAVRFARGLPEGHDKDVEVDFAIFRLSVYKGREDWKGDTLKEYFREDFEPFTQEMFRTLPLDTRRDLRAHLLDNGVFVPTGERVTIPNSLFRVVSEILDFPPGSRPIAQVGSVSRNNGQPGPPPSAFPTLPGPLPVGPTRTGYPPNDYGRNRNGDMNSAGTSSSDYAVSAMMKAYHYTSEKYSGKLSEDFGAKFKIFKNRCKLTGLPQHDKARAFPIMLHGPALQYYFDHIENVEHTFDGMVGKLRKRFETEERMIALTREWESMTLLGVLKENPSKSKKESLEIMINRLQELKSCLPLPYHSDIIFKNKLLTACEGIPECRLARQKVAPTIEGVISDLYTSIATSSSSQQPTDTTTALISKLFTERRRFNRNGKGGRKFTKKCNVCFKIGCWSTNHSREERLAAMKKNGRVRAYLLEHLGVDDNSNQGDDLNPVESDDDDINAFVMDLENIAEGMNDHEDQPEYEENCTAHFTCCDSFATDLADSSVSHALTSRVSNTSIRRYGGGKFYGIAIDTCCSYQSTGGIEQYKAYCQFVGANPKIDDSKKSDVSFGMGGTRSFGMARLCMPIGSTFVHFNVQVVNADVPILLSLADMNRLEMKFDNLANTLEHCPSGEKARVLLTFGHPFVVWNAFTQCMFTELELRRLHRRFGHPQTEKLLNILRRAEPDKVTETTRGLIEKIVAHCQQCQYHSQRPLRFKFALREDKHFNQLVYVDVLTIDKRPVLHVVDEATRYQAARWLPDMTADTVWNALRMCWIDVYIGPPDILAHDAGKELMARSFQRNANLMQISTKPIPVESPNSMTYVERYHTPLRRAYSIIRSDLDKATSEEVLQFAVKSLNDSVGPDGLVPTLLVYGALPRLGFPSDKPAPGTYERAVAVRKASEQMSRYFAKRQVRDALRTTNGPNVLDIHKAPLGSHVLVYRVHKCIWEGPFTLLNMDREACTVLLPDGPKKFRTTVVKPYRYPISEESSEAQGNTENSSEAPPSGESSNQAQDTQAQDLSSSFESSNSPPVTAFLTVTSPPVHENEECFVEAFSASQPSVDRKSRFGLSRAQEINGLIEQGVFSIVPKSAATGHRLFGSRFVDEVKGEGTKDERLKSRLVVQAYNDREHGLLTHAPTVQRSSQRLLFSLSMLFPKWCVILRDIMQAYTQSSTPLNRSIFVKPVPEFGLGKEMLLKVNRPLYGVPEAGMHWFNTYQRHHTERLGMSPSSHDLCLLYTVRAPFLDDNGKPAALTCLQTDDTLSLANLAFKKLEEKESARFRCKPSSVLAEGCQINFNGMILSKNACEIEVRAAVSSREVLAPICTDPLSKEEYVAQRARGAYIASVCRPDLSYGFAAAAQHTAPDTAQARTLNSLIKRAISTRDLCLKFVPLDLSSLSVAVFIDASFANNPDHKSQLGQVTVLMDKHNHANIVHYGSVKCQRITRSALASELYAMVYGFDQSFVLHKAIGEFLGKKLPLRLYTDSQSLFESLTTLNTTSEKRLLIDLSMLRESYERREIADVFWIPGDQNPADDLTKKNPCAALINLMKTNRMVFQPKAWIERSTPAWAFSPKQIKSSPTFANS